MDLDEEHEVKSLKRTIEELLGLDEDSGEDESASFEECYAKNPLLKSRKGRVESEIKVDDESLPVSFASKQKSAIAEGLKTPKPQEPVKKRSKHASLDRSTHLPAPLNTATTISRLILAPLQRQLKVPPANARLTLAGSMPRSISKSKKRAVLKLVPEEHQVFKNLYFYFLPNDDVAPGRRLRMWRALEHGAVWIKDWTEGITHVVIERDLDYQDLIKYLKVENLPATVVLVNEFYISDCISYKYLLNPCQPMYHVPGTPQGHLLQASKPKRSGSVLCETEANEREPAVPTAETCEKPVISLISDSEVAS